MQAWIEKKEAMELALKEWDTPEVFRILNCHPSLVYGASCPIDMYTCITRNANWKILHHLLDVRKNIVQAQDVQDFTTEFDGLLRECVQVSYDHYQLNILDKLQRNYPDDMLRAMRVYPSCLSHQDLDRVNHLVYLMTRPKFHEYSQDDYYSYSLAESARKNRLGEFKKCFANHASIQFKVLPLHSNPILLAIKNDAHDIIRFLLDENEKYFELRDENHFNLLEYAALYASSATLEILLNYPELVAIAKQSSHAFGKANLLHILSRK